MLQFYFLKRINPTRFGGILFIYEQSSSSRGKNKGQINFTVTHNHGFKNICLSQTAIQNLAAHALLFFSKRTPSLVENIYIFTFCMSLDVFEMPF